jgi:hypothetical protein
MWFAQAEAQFPRAGSSSKRTKFHCVISQLDQRYAGEVEEIITSPPLQDPYSKLKTELLKLLSISREQRAHWILTLEEMSDSKPSQFLMHLRSLVPDLPDYFLRTIWTSRLPAKAQATLACPSEVELDAAADCADRIIETVPPPPLPSSGQPTDNNELLRRIEELSRRVAGLSAERDRASSRDHRSSSRDRPSSSRDPHSSPRNCSPYDRLPPPPRHDVSTTCWYHQSFGNRVQDCSEPCTCSQQEKLAQQTSAVAHDCATATGRLFIIDKSTKQRFPIDRRSGLCVFPRKLISQRRERVNHGLCAPNGTTIRSYGWLPLSLNLELRREFTWRFVVADVTQPLIGACEMFSFHLSSYKNISKCISFVCFPTYS